MVLERFRDISHMKAKDRHVVLTYPQPFAKGKEACCVMSFVNFHGNVWFEEQLISPRLSPLGD